MNKVKLVTSDGVWYKANLHCHTTVSDGRLTPEEVKKVYMEQGYSIVAFTDHRKYIYHRELNDDQFLAIASYEVDMNGFMPRGAGFDRMRTYHLNVYDKFPERNSSDKKAELLEPYYGNIAYLNQYIQNRNREGCLVCYNHPYWSLQEKEDYVGLQGLWAMEVYNHGCEQEGGYGYHPQVYDEMLRSGQELFSVATDDNHNAVPKDNAKWDSCGGFTMIHAKEFTYGAVMEALEKGDFYCSFGPQIKEMTIGEDGTVRVRTSPAERIYLKTRGRRGISAFAASGETIEEAEFKLDGTEGYIWLDVVDAKGKHAHTNAYFIGR